MRTESDIRMELAQAAIDARALSEKVNGGQIGAAEARDALAKLQKRNTALHRELGEAIARPKAAVGSGLITREALLKAAAEKRAIAIGTVGTAGIGAIQQVREIFKEIAENDSLLNLASYYYGPNASTNIPVLSPMDEPKDYDEGETSVDLDTGTGITVTELQPKAHAITLTVTAEMLTMGSIDIEGEIPSIFAKAFSTKMHKGMLTGSGSGKLMKGIFTSAAAHEDGIATAGAAKITVTELAELALKVASKDASFRIIMSPSVYQGILSDSADGEDIKVYKEGLIRDKSIEGVSLLLDPYAPAQGDGGILAVACPLSRYAIGVAGELVITPKYKPQDTMTYFDAIMFFTGKQISDTDLYSIKAAADEGGD